MKEYQEQESGNHSLLGGLPNSIPNTIKNRRHRQMLREIAAGVAAKIQYVAPTLPPVGDIPISAADEDEIIRLRPANRPTPAERLEQQLRMRARRQA